VFKFLPEGSPEKMPYLNVRTLFDALKKALRAYESDLDSDITLQTKFKSRHEALVSNDYKEMKILRKLCGE
jgi:hypothetical protein